MIADGLTLKYIFYLPCGFLTPTALYLTQFLGEIYLKIYDIVQIYLRLVLKGFMLLVKNNFTANIL